MDSLRDQICEIIQTIDHDSDRMEDEDGTYSHHNVGADWHTVYDKRCLKCRLERAVEIFQEECR